MAVTLPVRCCLEVRQETDRAAAVGAAPRRPLVAEGWWLTPFRAHGCVGAVEPVSFRGEVRFWNPEKQGGLAVVDVPQPQVGALGGLRQQRVHGDLNGSAFTSSVMPAGGGRLAMSVSKAMLKAAGIAVGDVAEVRIVRIGA